MLPTLGGLVTLWLPRLLEAVCHRGFREQAAERACCSPPRDPALFSFYCPSLSDIKQIIYCLSPPISVSSMRKGHCVFPVVPQCLAQYLGHKYWMPKCPQGASAQGGRQWNDVINSDDLLCLSAKHLRGQRVMGLENADIAGSGWGKVSPRKGHLSGGLCVRSSRDLPWSVDYQGLIELSILSNSGKIYYSERCKENQHREKACDWSPEETKANSKSPQWSHTGRT